MPGRRPVRRAGRLRSTLSGLWWKAYFKRIRHCFVCGRRLARRYVPAEKRRRLVCVGCGEITYTNPKVVAGMVPEMPDGRIALLRREIEPARGKWSYPAGFQEMAESVEDAAVRETWEEIRAKVISERLLGVYSYPDAGVVTVVYAGRIPKGQTPRPGEESQEVQLFSPAEIPWKELAFRSTTDALKDWLAMRRKRSGVARRARLSPRKQLGK